MDGLKINRIERLLQGVRGLESIGVAALPGEKLTVAIGDTVRVRATVDYRGPRLDDYFYGAIGNREFYGFDEVTNNDVPITLPSSIDWLSYELTVDIPAPNRAGLFDLYVKISGHTEAGLPEVSNVIEVIGVAEFANFEIVSYERITT